MISPLWRSVACIAATAAACLGVAGAAAQVPPVPPAPEGTTTVPTSKPPTDATPPAPSPEEGPPPVLDPADAPTPATPPATTAPGTPVGAAPSRGPSPTKSGEGHIPPARAAKLDPSPLTIDLSGLADLRRRAVGKAPRTAVRDGGFDSSLPFQPGASQFVDRSVEPIELGAEEDRIARVRSVAAVAAGFLTLVLLGVAVWVLRQARPDVGPRAGT